jgi:hypothetical protein
LLAENRRVGGGIRAIGVVGTDVYDKLLILRALRPSFPHAVFFTTDLDADLGHPDEYRSARNLIVASHFGLQLDRELQGHTAPFRDSYQAATYFACLLALECPALEPRVDAGMPWAPAAAGGRRPMSPLLFEIGRNGPYQLTLVTDDRLAVHPRGPRQESFPYLSLIFAALGLVSLVWLVVSNVPEARSLSARATVRLQAWMPNHPRWAKRICKYAAPGIVVFSVALFALLALLSRTWADFEPFDLVNGVSSWPAILLRLLVVLELVAFLVYRRLAERPAVRTINEKNFAVLNSIYQDPGLLVSALRRPSERDIWTPFHILFADRGRGTTPTRSCTSWHWPHRR